MLRRIVLIGILLAIPMTAGATKYPLTVKDCRGKSVSFTREPSRIVSIAPSNTEILFALGLESKVVGVTRYCDYPAAAKKKTQVGDRTISTERVMSLRPDLVLAHGTVSKQAIEALEKRGLKVFAIDPTTIAGVVTDIKLVGKITNREKQAATVAGKITSAQNEVRRKVAGQKAKPSVLVAVQADPVWAAGPKTFVDEMIRLAGGSNIASNAKPGFNQISNEIVIARNPEVIIGTTKGDAQIFGKGFWANTSAARSKRVHEADADLLVRPGPRLADGILTIAKLIHPNVFGKS